MLRKLFRTLTAPFRFIGRLFSRFFRFLTRIGNRVKNFFTQEPEDTPLGDAFSKTIDNPLGVMEHLDALRKHLFRAMVMFLIATAIAFNFSEQILNFISEPLTGGSESLVAIEVTEPLSTLMRISLLTGFAIALPYIALEIWLFVAPGIRRKTRLLGLMYIPIVVIFFIGGMAFTYYVMLPTALPFLLSILDLRSQVRPSSYINFSTSMLFWVGLSFEFPLVIFLLASLGIVNYKSLLQQWRLAIVVIALIAAIITPTVDPINMGLVMLPLTVLYFLGIFLAFIAQKRKDQAASKQII